MRACTFVREPFTRSAEYGVRIDPNSLSWPCIAPAGMAGVGPVDAEWFVAFDGEGGSVEVVVLGVVATFVVAFASAEAAPPSATGEASRGDSRQPAAISAKPTIHATRMPRRR